MIIEVGQQWESENSPHEDFKIYSVVNANGIGIFLWERANREAFDSFLVKMKGKTTDELIRDGKNTFPYPWTGECTKKTLSKKIRKYQMMLIDEIKNV